MQLPESLAIGRKGLADGRIEELERRMHKRSAVYRGPAYAPCGTPYAGYGAPRFPDRRDGGVSVHRQPVGNVPKTYRDEAHRVQRVHEEPFFLPIPKLLQVISRASTKYKPCGELGSSSGSFYEPQCAPMEHKEVRRTEGVRSGQGVPFVSVEGETAGLYFDVGANTASAARKAAKSGTSD